MATFSSGTWLRLATSSTTGISRTTPISKNSGRPISAATPAIAHGSRASDTRDGDNNRDTRGGNSDRADRATDGDDN